MKRFCSYCKKHYGDKEPFEGDVVTHGICEDCFEWLKKNRNQTLREFLNGFDFPILAVDPDINVHIANIEAEKMLGKSLDEIEGSSGGEAVECEYARLPGGCGRSEHCKPCAIRNTVTETCKTGKAVKDMIGYQNIISGNRVEQVRLWISAEKKGDMVLLKIEQDGEPET